ncbi:Tyrosine-protein kinase BTK [Holothuria leucospilota]|uniref:Tyrosine-protein kinase BTK n=1 Tax=Holothuria leucospilota TaxID=206669 RepID=A0A9Q1CCA5_HOLLE|nr:Tyrosine-protein kinase BTK [Holothuria leucospilota]
MTLEISSPAASTLRGPVHSSEGFIYYSRRLPLEAATVAYESSISDPNYSLVPEYQGDYYSKVQDKTSKNRNFKAKDMCLIINIKLGPVYNIWMGTIALDNDTNKSVVISTATDQILQSQEIHWDEYVKRVLDLPSNKNLVSVVGICIDTVNLYLLHEHVACETLDKRIQSTKILEDWKTNLMTPSEVLSYVKGILEGLELVHSYGFLHPGLTTKKILVTDQGECKLYDFCLSKDAVAKVAIAHTQMLNNLNHFAPETLLRNTYTQACDVWSIGVVIWEICSGGSHPFPATEESITRLKQLPLPPDKWPDEYQALKNRRVFDCWEEEVSLRPSLNQLRLSFSKISDSLEHYDGQPTVGASLEHVEDFSDVNILRTPMS